MPSHATRQDRAAVAWQPQLCVCDSDTIVSSSPSPLVPDNHKNTEPLKDFAFCSQEKKGETLDGALGNQRYLFIAGLGIKWPLKLPSNPNIL